MSTTFKISDTKKVIYVSSDANQPCPLCRQHLNAGDIARSINHILDSHQYKLLHIGTETTDDADGRPWLKTVAVLGA